MIIKFIIQTFIIFAWLRFKFLYSQHLGFILFFTHVTRYLCDFFFIFNSPFYGKFLHIKKRPENSHRHDFETYINICGKERSHKAVNQRRISLRTIPCEFHGDWRIFSFNFNRKGANALENLPFFFCNSIGNLQ